MNSPDMNLSLPMDKLINVQESCHNLVEAQQVTIRELAQVIGKLLATLLAVLPAPLHYRRLQMQGHQQWEITVIPIQAVRTSDGRNTNGLVCIQN